MAGIPMPIMTTQFDLLPYLGVRVDIGGVADKNSTNRNVDPTFPFDFYIRDAPDSNFYYSAGTGTGYRRIYGYLLQTANLLCVYSLHYSVNKNVLCAVFVVVFHTHCIAFRC